ncbi:5-hydroxyisourate hydrolase 1-like [Microplitis mediator]|uniref:5-hydroxyisourate hydrolase 1-like n=1 Tax=Microplitis mediator TaxID=375433 RepID=UPI0025557C2D|nr:5-hydroxyisourate hydrolase 1-like [Microplitis mediator]
MNTPHISTHVLDTSRGLPVANLPVSLYKNTNTWTLISESKTTSDGRCSDLLELAGQSLTIGRYKLKFNVENYFITTERSSLYPIIEVIFDIKSLDRNYHLPLLLNPFGYSTYRGT